jgi:hypothetical protein
MLLSNIVYSQSVPSYVPTNGLVGWWGFNGNAQDGSGNGNHGTVNGATLTTDRFGNQNGAYDFDGINFTHIEIPSDSSLDLVNDFSISCWFNSNLMYNQPATVRSILMKAGDGVGMPNGYTYGIWGGIAGTNSQVGVVNFQAQPHYTSITYPNNSSGHVSINTWYNYIVTYTKNDSTLKYYINNVVVDVKHLNFNIGFNNNPLWIGSQPSIYSSTKTFDGKIDDIGIWNRALTQQEITNLYNSQLPAQTSLCLPTITTSSPTSVGVDTVVIGGDISNDGGSSIVLRGVCYSTSPNPNMGNQRTEDGSGIGSFNTVLRGLNPSSTYYARSYAKNSNGVVVYGNEVSFSTSSITIGSNYAGGIVFYVDSTGQHGLVCAPNDQGNYSWGCQYVIPIATSQTIGSGQSNTNVILSTCTERPIAASICDNLVLNGYSDWYLPSRDEIYEMLNNLALQNLGGFANPNLGWYAYWSSTHWVFPQYHSRVFVVFFAPPTIHPSFIGVDNYSDQNSEIHRVRAIRSF